MNKNYIIIGDSITYGMGDTENGGWASRLKNHFLKPDTSSNGHSIINIAGYPGATTFDILERLDSILDSFKYDLISNEVILFIGVNDTNLFKDSVENTVSNFKKNIEDMFKKVKERDFKLTILGISKIGLNEDPDLNDDYYYNNYNIDIYDLDFELIKRFNTELENICKSNNIRFISLWDIIDKDDLIDGLHPNSMGHKKICDEVLKYIN